MFISNDNPARFHVMLLDPITGKILYDESNHLQMTPQPVRCFTVDTMSYLKFVAKAQTTSGETLAILAERRKELLDSLCDKKLLDQIVKHVDYAINPFHTHRDSSDPKREAEVFDQLCQLNTEILKALQVVTLKEVVKRVLFDSDCKPSKTLMFVIFVDHNGNEMVLDGIEVPHPVTSIKPLAAAVITQPYDPDLINLS